jgi:hypothetical protein
MIKKIRNKKVNHINQHHKKQYKKKIRNKKVNHINQHHKKLYNFKHKIKH